MDLLKSRILSEGVIIGTDIVKVDGFLNHQVDPVLLREIACEIKRRYAGTEITKVLTIESSGIAIAAFVALELGVPFVFAKKFFVHQTENLFRKGVYKVHIARGQGSYRGRLFGKGRRARRAYRYYRTGGGEGCGLRDSY